ncbi:hypothetical protein F441_17069 [Phytophthora nicotianae CJ01A1]|uniref:Uncharacterized protein n=3 Tax=Phytophthora nicotianae TaxID=4792 RepID=W2YKA7_PHYNI|nr:hypothetical protein L915_16738 [Phytophthora nicotianae]ETL30366.1 hypothetical protein L916_16647 [Phytophthora nicotianae]ETL83594.1 hypothetical protein L917_16468 [Phytophthora nicotianae]ETP06564.1 hypothetical protein F441_17069 [Phytophthora nicotianae CJ01A1]ETP34639.1 hypothetical protein F442_17069 [Phytophthora nicotianae P10297]
MPAGSCSVQEPESQAEAQGPMSQVKKLVTLKSVARS